MANSIFISSTEAKTGKSLVSLSVMDLILKKVNKVGFFKPVIARKDGSNDKHIQLISEYFNLEQCYEESYGVYWGEVNELLGQGKMNELVERVLQKFKKLEEKVDFVVCEGTNFNNPNSAFESDLNIEMAKNFSCPVLLVGNAKGKNEESILNNINLAIDSFQEKSCEVLGIVINRVPQSLEEILERNLKNKLSKKVKYISIISEDPILNSPTVREVADHLGAEVIFGKYKLSLQAHRFSIAAMQIENYLERITDHNLVITPGDRADILMGAIMAHRSKNFPSISGIIFTGGILPSPKIMKLLEGLPYTIPILSVETNSYDTATKLDNLHPQFDPEEPDKIYFALAKFEEYAKTDFLMEEIVTIKTTTVTPKMFEYIITKKAKEQKKRIVLPEGEDERVLKASSYLLDRGIVDITLLGDEEKINSNIAKLGLDLKGVEIINPLTSTKLEEYAKTFYEARRHKGVNMDMARDWMSDVSYYGTMMVHLGHAHGMVSGSVNTTQHTIRPALQFVKTKPGFKAVSSVFFMCLSDRVIVYGDCAINPNPDAELLAEIAGASAQTAKSFGIEPRIAMLSYSSGSSGKGEEVEKVRKATKILKEKYPDYKIEGPIQYDAAVDPEVGQKKMPGSEVAGKATVLIFPDLNTGNNTYKAVQRETGAVAIGPVLQGLNKPVNDLSRGCLVPDIINTVIITSIQAQEE